MSRWAKSAEDVMADAARSQAQSARRIAAALERLDYQCPACGYPHADRYGEVMHDAQRALREVVHYFDGGRMPPAGFPLASVVTPAYRALTEALDPGAFDAPSATASAPKERDA